MAYRNRRRVHRYGKRRSFSNYGRPRGGGRPPYYTVREDQADLTVAVGERRIWVFNNTGQDVVIPAGGYVELRIVSEGEGRVGYRYRAALVNGAGAPEGGGRGERPGPEERLEEWV
jgi:hypothetical protein